MAQHRQVRDTEIALVWRPGVTRLAETAMAIHGETALARRRGITMTELAKALSAARVTATVSTIEPDGARWSISVSCPGEEPGSAP